MDELNLYEVLGVAPDAGRDEIRAAYRGLARETHPDTGGDDAAFAAVALAWWTLSDASRRARYDAGVDEDQDEDLWGEDLAWDDQPRRPAPPPRPAPRPAPGPRPEDPGADGVGDPGPRGLPAPASGPVDPLTSGPVRLPTRARPTGMRDPLGAEFRRPVLACGGAVLLTVAVVIAVPSLAASEAAQTSFVTTLAFLTVFGAGLWLRATAHRAGFGTRALAAVLIWGSLAFQLFMAAGTVAFEHVPPGDVAVAGVSWLATAGLAVESGRRIRRTRARERLDRVAYRRLLLAHRWNHVLDLQQQHGAAHLERGTVRGRAAWLLVADGSGTVLVRAPANAVRSWVHVLREQGVDVLPVPAAAPV
ncbi:J domain-containing protein [Cellulomonas sp. P4]|uniref:J domain-containing protein n=1 Tax=Cellulomonas sp. P4 TaxID=3142533 RepID=UPI0031BABE6B